MSDDLIARRESALLASYAMFSANTAGRIHPEPQHDYRGPYQRDRDRIIHSSAYRRLAHKTQVFTGEMGDYHRTRLTHTLEVASIARTLARALGLNEDLVEALALLHDIGHPPFGHAGEQVLNECLSEEGGFNHNQHALRIVQLLEIRYPTFSGLNLSREVLEGQAFRAGGAARRGERPLLEVQAVDAADSIAYDAHDADDAIQVGLLRLEELMLVPIWHEAVRHARRQYANLEDATLRRAAVHWLIDRQVGDVLASARMRISESPIRTIGDVRAGDVVLAPSSQMATEKEALESFLFERVYRHPDVLEKRAAAQQALRAMYCAYLNHSDQLPAIHRSRSEDAHARRVVADYLAEMTDRFAREDYARLCASGLCGTRSHPRW